VHLGSTIFALRRKSRELTAFYHETGRLLQSVGGDKIQPCDRAKRR
jgi:hypothetical protein